MHIPTLNAFLNASAAVFLLLGFYFIKQKRQTAHWRCMLSATVLSALFLISYIIYHYQHGSTRFSGQGLWRMVYFGILIPHTLLAMVLLPLVIRTLLLARKQNWEKHKAMARITFPAWLFVSVSGVAVYCMLYQMKF